MQPIPRSVVQLGKGALLRIVDSRKQGVTVAPVLPPVQRVGDIGRLDQQREHFLLVSVETGKICTQPHGGVVGEPLTDFRGMNRSEEHTSELQSLMRISYAVFCLKKKNYN